MSTLFDPVQAGDLKLANRIVMAPLTRNRSPNAIPTALAPTYYAQRASAGLLIDRGGSFHFERSCERTIDIVFDRRRRTARGRPPGPGTVARREGRGGEGQAAGLPKLRTLACAPAGIL